MPIPPEMQQEIDQLYERRAAVPEEELHEWLEDLTALECKMLADPEGAVEDWHAENLKRLEDIGEPASDEKPKGGLA